MRRAVPLGLALLAACKQAETAPIYEKVPVERRDVVVTVISQGMIRPILTFSVKSKAWGEIVAQPVATGDEVHKGQLLTTVDPRLPQNNLTQAQASVDKARAQLVNATAQLARSEALFKSGALAETDYDATKLAAATAQSAVATAEANLLTAQDAMEDTHVRAPITGTILELDAVLGTVISSPTLGGGTVILKMASLDSVQDSALVLETDVGRVRPGMPASITVDAFPGRSFEGTVASILPQAQVVQNATMFPVLVRVPNPGHMLKPGMNAEVRIHTGQRQGVLTVPNAALRTPRDVGTAASMLGLDSVAVAEQIAAAQATDSARRTAGSGPARAPGGGDSAGGANTVTLPNGRTVTLPPGVTREQLQAVMQRMRSGTPPSAEDRALLGRLFGRGPRSGGSPNRQARNNQSYVVFVLRAGKLVAAPIKTGLTDQDYVEVTSGLMDRDTVLVLPSASLVQSQQQFKQRFQNVTGGGLPGLRQQSGGSR
ncbi:MAG TPA: efflux RND transporter periplasmic adaptor subunit [Gemmatimonadales bacterium]|nr:efflux RND transporter periplasmic adaptor subunit [Gemmatimonadales bacterium]